MVPFTLGELATAITIMAASLGGLLAVCMKSKCDQVRCCCGLVELHRQVAAEEPAPAIPQQQV